MPDRPQAVPTVQIDNARVIVTEWRFAPGAETGWHRHAHDYVVVPTTGGDAQPGLVAMTGIAAATPALLGAITRTIWGWGRSSDEE